MKQSTANILSQLDLNQTHAAVHSVVMPEFEYQDIVTRILHAADIFLEKDLVESKALIVEHNFDNVVRGIFDIVKVSHEDKTVIIDWKTTTDVKRPNFADETRNEFQTSFYLSFGGEELVTKLGFEAPAYLEYRCIDEKEQWRTKNGEQYLAAPANVLVFQELNHPGRFADATAQLNAVHAQYDSQVSLIGPWARNRPRACFKGWEKGPQCPFFDDCSNMTMPLLTEEHDVNHYPRSKSAIKDFIECPEKFRRLRVLKEIENIQKPLPVLRGEAFHEGIADLYQQAWDLKERGDLKL